MSASPSRLNLRAFSTNQPLTLAFLTALAIIVFVAVTAISKMYDAQQESLAVRWASRGAADLEAHRYPAAVIDFRTSLLYSRDDADYQLHLAQALMGETKYDEAEAYLTNLWERHPEDGEVNLELARVYAFRNENDRATRYYHNAIYAAWPADHEHERQEARFELINLLLREKNYAQAQSELIALAANLGDNPEERAHAGSLFLAAQDNDHALQEFRMSLRLAANNAAALAGAGRAAFELARYPEAARYLREAVSKAPGDTASASLLRVADDVLKMDPFREGLSASDRDRIAIDDFNAAGTRLDGCTAPPASSPLLPWQTLKQNWTALQPSMTPAALRRNPDNVQAAMNLVFNIEHETAGVCGPLTETDTALQLIANLREGS